MTMHDDIMNAAPAGDDGLYKENILDHYRNPRHKGRLDGAAVRNRQLNPSCGDALEFFLDVGKDGIVRDVAFDGNGCAISQAAASMLAERIDGMALGDIARLGEDDVFTMLGVHVGPSRRKCALLALKTVQTSISALNRNA